MKSWCLKKLFYCRSQRGPKKKVRLSLYKRRQQTLNDESNQVPNASECAKSDVSTSTPNFVRQPNKTIQAPKKRSAVSTPSRARKKLCFGQNYIENCGKRIKLLSDSLVDKLYEGKVLHDFMTFLEQIVCGNFNVSNIAFLLCLERAKLSSMKTTTEMTYSKQTLKFWKVVYRLLGGKAIRLFSGPKHKGQIVLDECRKGYYMPTKAKCNFAVPDVQVLRGCQDDRKMPKIIRPGILSESVEVFFCFLQILGV